MKRKENITINQLEGILKKHFDCDSVWIENVFVGSRISDMEKINLGPGSVMDLNVQIFKYTKDDSNSFSFNVVERFGKEISDLKERIDYLERERAIKK